METVVEKSGLFYSSDWQRKTTPNFSLLTWSSWAFPLFLMSASHHFTWTKPVSEKSNPSLSALCKVGNCGPIPLGNSYLFTFCTNSYYFPWPQNDLDPLEQLIEQPIDLWYKLSKYYLLSNRCFECRLGDDLDRANCCSCVELQCAHFRAEGRYVLSAYGFYSREKGSVKRRERRREKETERSSYEEYREG